MGQQNRTTLKSYFETDDIPTQAQFVDLIDSQLNISEDDLDDITEGTTNKHFSATEQTKLSGIEANADVTDATNVGSAMSGATAKTTPVDADTMPLNDSAASNVLKKVTWSNIKATLKTYFDSLYSALGHTHTESDITDLNHTDSNAIHDNVSGEIAALTEKASPVSADLVVIEDSAASNAKKKVQLSNLPSAGETNTASNVGVGGVGVFKQKNGVDFEFKNINAGSSKITVTDDTTNDEVDIDVAEANITHDNLSGAGTNTHAQIDTHIAASSAHGVSGSVVGTSDTQTLTNKTITTPTLTLKQGLTPAPTAEGDIQWDTDGNQIVVGDGTGTKTFSDDSVVLDRVNHTGTQTASTISDFDTEVSNNTDVAANTTHRGTTTGNPHNVTASDVGALANVVEDTTPQLGGTLDTQGNTIDAGTGNDLVFKLGDASGTNKVSITNSSDVEKISIDSSGSIVMNGNLYANGGTLTISEKYFNTIVAYFQGNNSAVNRLRFHNSATGNPVKVEAEGTDTNIDVNIVPKGTGVLQENGTEVSKVGHTHLKADVTDLNAYEVGGTDVAVADGGTGASTAAGARTNLGLGTIATQAANNVSITGGSISGITDLAIADGGTGASDAATAFSNLKQAATTTATGVAELATLTEVNTGTDTSRIVTPDTLAGSYAGKKSVGVMLVEPSTDVATGTNKAFFTIPEDLAGMNLISVHAEVITAGTTGVTTFDINKNGTSMLSTKLTIDSGETGSDTAATAAVIDTTNDDVAENDVITIDVDGVSTTAPKGAFIRLTFQLP